MAQKIVIYQDAGVSEFSLFCLLKFFEKEDVHLCNAQDVIDGRTLEKAALFAMPGGADLPYCKKLNGAGNRNIRSFVETGGTYLGICAGAYYGCAAIEFHKGREDEICGERELALIDAVAYGSLPALAPHYDQTLRSAAIADLVLQDGSETQAFYQGGCAFHVHDDSTEIAARYKDVPGHPPAIITKQIGQGRAILSGVHFEITPALLSLHPLEGEDATRLSALALAYLQTFHVDIF